MITFISLLCDGVPQEDTFECCKIKFSPQIVVYMNTRDTQISLEVDFQSIENVGKWWHVHGRFELKGLSIQFIR